MILSSMLVATALLAAGSTPPSETPAPTGVSAVSDEPPPSAWDRRQAELRAGKTPASPAPDDEISWGSQLLKTVLALALVIGLLYALFRLGLTRFIGVTALRGPAKSMRVLERQQLDARHALYIVELEGGRRMLIATGEQGVQRIAELDLRPAAGRGDFSKELADAAARDESRDPASEDADARKQG